MRTAKAIVVLAGLVLAGCGDGGRLTGGGDGAGDSLSAVDGMWGITATACNAGSGMRDGIVEISGATIRTGPDTCDIASAEPLASGGWRLTAQCTSGEDGEAYEASYVAAVTPGGGLSWTDEAQDRTQTYVTCANGTGG
jgi:hypothetical protein